VYIYRELLGAHDDVSAAEHQSLNCINMGSAPSVHLFGATDLEQLSLRSGQHGLYGLIDFLWHG